MSTRNYNIIAGIFFLVYFVHGLIMIPAFSITYDEGDHFQYAIRYVKGHPEKIRPFDDASTMPITSVNTLPRLAEQVLHPGLAKKDGGISDIVRGRYMTLLFCAWIGWFVLSCSTKLFGRKAGLFSLFLFVFCPNLNGHAVLVTTDAFSALFTLSSAWFLARALETGSWRNVLLLGFHLGMAQLAKQSLTHLLILFPLVAIVYAWIHRHEISLRIGIARTAAAIAVLLFVIAAGFQFSHWGEPAGAYHFRSHFFQSLQERIGFLRKVPLPFPEPYIAGLDLTKNIDELGPGRPESSPPVYLLGQYRSGSGFWYYYFVVLAFKTPIPVILLTLILGTAYIHSRKLVLTEKIFLAVIAYLLIYFNFFYDSQVGLRHILMLYPLLYVLLGRLAEWLLMRRRLITLLVIWQLAGFYYYFPNLISYTNEFVLPKRDAWKKMADSNIEYGQSYHFLEAYMAKHPEVKKAGPVPGPGKWVVGINDYLGLNEKDSCAWMRAYRPAGHVQHGYLLFDIPSINRSGE